MAMSKVGGKKVKAPGHKAAAVTKPKMPGARGGFQPMMQGGPKAGAKQKNLSK